jgi:NAD(P)-dependent dehydrogenase (short-subunit alcohol dehydrogenase family)
MMGEVLAGRVAVVVGSPVGGPAGDIIQALAAAGAGARLVPPEGPFGEPPPDVVVFAHVAAGALDPRPVIEVGDREWDAWCEEPIRAALHTAQAAYPLLRGRDGRLIFVCPAVALEGAAGLVPLATAAEAQRMLAKSAARRWGREGITVNVVTAPLGGGSDATRTVAALDPGDGVAASVVWLASAAARTITGATIGADGGAVMAP